MDQLGHQNGAGGAQRVAVGDRAAIWVEAKRIDRVLVQPGQRHAGEGLVDLEQINIVQPQAGPLEDAGRGRDRPIEHEHGVRADGDPGDDARQRLQAVAAHGAFRGNQQGRRAVADLAAVSSRDDAIGLEDRLEVSHLLPVGRPAHPLILHNIPRLSVRLREM